MIIIYNQTDLDNFLASSTNNRLTGVLALRRDLIDLATFVLVEPNDDVATITDIVGFAIDSDFPPWEWVLEHSGTWEAPIITSDDGSGFILIVPDLDGIDTTLRDLLRSRAEAAEPIG